VLELQQRLLHADRAQQHEVRRARAACCLQHVVRRLVVDGPGVLLRACAARATTGSVHALSVDQPCMAVWRVIILLPLLLPLSLPPLLQCGQVKLCDVCSICGCSSPACMTSF
jgi:hypothetical protein